MLLILIATFCVAAAVADDQPCFKYAEKPGNFTKSLGETVNECRKKFGMTQPEEAHCVLWQYGTVDKETYQLNCEQFANYIEDVMFDGPRKENMKQYGMKDCDCKEDLPFEKRKEFITCWKNAFGKACPEDKQLDGGMIKVPK